MTASFHTLIHVYCATCQREYDVAMPCSAVCECGSRCWKWNDQLVGIRVRTIGLSNGLTKAVVERAA